MLIGARAPPVLPILPDGLRQHHNKSTSTGIDEPDAPETVGTARQVGKDEGLGQRWGEAGGYIGC